MAVAKVEEMTRQLEDIRSGKVKSASNQQSPAAMAELEKLKKELMVGNSERQSKWPTNKQIFHMSLYLLYLVSLYNAFWLNI